MFSLISFLTSFKFSFSLYFVIFFNSLAMQYEDFVDLLNSLTNRHFKYLSIKARRQFRYLMENEVTEYECKKVIVNAYMDKFHKDCNFKYLTPEFLTRPDKFEKFLNITNSQFNEQEAQEAAKDRLNSFIDNLLLKNQNEQSTTIN